MTLGRSRLHGLKRMAVAVALLAAGMAAAPALRHEAGAAPGDFDPTFGGGDGALSVDFGPPKFSKDLADAVVEPDGRITSVTTAVVPSGADHPVVVRVDAAGNPDRTFGVRGAAFVTPGGSGLGRGDAIARQADGKLLVGFTYGGPTDNGNFGVARLLPDGGLDTSFATGGIWRDAAAPVSGELTGIAVQPDGKVLVTGHRSGTGGEEASFVHRLTAAGVPDPTFGTDGARRYFRLAPVGADGSNHTRFRDIAVLGDGRIIVAGGAASSVQGSGFVVVRLSNNGMPDPTFDGDGVAFTRFNASPGFADEAWALTVEPDGQVIAAGSSDLCDGGSGRSLALARYNTDGTLDLLFGSSGKVVDCPGGAVDEAQDVAVQSDGAIVVAGTSFDGESDGALVARYTALGARDATFNAPNGAYISEQANNASLAALGLLADGRVATAGTWRGTPPGLLVQRYTSLGALDSTFAGTGNLTLRGASHHDIVKDLARQGDGKLIVAGFNEGVGGDDEPDFLLSRHLVDGRLDPSFGDGGSVLTDFGNTIDRAGGVAIQPDGNYVLAGNTDNRLALARYLANGALDNSFGTGGRVVLDLDEGTEWVTAVDTQPDGRTVVAGHVGTGADFVTRLLPSGTPDPAFAGDGTARLDVPGAGESVEGMALQPDGKIVVAGSTDNGATFVARFRSDGVLDPGFGVGGLRTVDVTPTAEVLTSVAIAPSDGRIVAVGATDAYASTAADLIVALTPAGALDQSFSGDGIVIDDISGSADRFHDVDIQMDGKIVAAGTTDALATGSGGFLVARYTSSGGRDTAFDDDGFVNTLVTFGGVEGAEAVLIAPNGSVVAAGYGQSPRGDYDVSLVRLEGDQIAPTLNVTVDQSVIPASPAVFDAEDIPWSPSAPGLAGSPVVNPGLIDFPVVNPGIIGFPVVNPGLIDFPVVNPGIIDFPVVNPGIIDFPVLRSITLAQIPLLDGKKWDDVVPGLPLTTTTLAEVLALDPAPPALAQLRVSDIDWSGVPLGKMTAAALAAGRTRFRDIATPSGGPGWCARFEALGQPACGAAFGGVDASPLAYEISGGDMPGTQLASFTVSAFNFSATAPVVTAKLVDIERSAGLRNGALGSVRLAAIPAGSRDRAVDCSKVSCSGGTNVADAAAAGALRSGGTVADLGSTTNPDGTVTLSGPAGGFSYGEVVASLLPADAYDLERAPLDAVPLELLDGDAGEVSVLTYTLGHTNNTDSPEASSSSSLTLFAGSRYIPGSATRSIDGGAFEPTADPAISGQTLTFAGSPLDSGQTVRWRVQVRPGIRTGGPFTVSASTSWTNNDPNTPSAGAFAVTGTAPVTIVDPFEANDVAEEAVAIEPNRIYAPHMDGGLDWFKIPVPVNPDGTAQVGARLRVLASHLPVDIDLVTYLDAGGGTEFRPNPPPLTINGAPVVNPGLIGFPVEDRPPGVDSDSGVPATATLDDIPVDRTRTVAGYSTNRGLTDEVADVVVPDGVQAGDFLYIQFSGFLQVSSPDPYYFRVQTDAPMALPPCSPIKFGSPGAGIDAPQTPVPTDTETLFLLSSRRLGNMYGRDRATAVQSALVAPTFLNRDDVKGAVVSLDTGPQTALAQAFAAYDQNPCSATVTNALVKAVISRMDSFLTANHRNLKRVQIVGTTEIIPAAMFADRTLLVNERGYEELEFTTVDRDANGAALPARSNNTHAGARGGFVFSDAPYGDYAVTEYPGGTVPVPELAVARQLETPEDIAFGINRFVERNGTLDLGATRLFAAGSEFADDAVQAVDNAFAANYPTASRTLLSGRQWSAADAEREFLAAADKPGAAALGGHQNHFSWQAGDGSMAYSRNATGSFQDRLVISSSCHGALNVPDTLLRHPTQPGAAPTRLTQADALKDWPQTYARAAAFVGPTGFSYGDRYSVGWTERLMTATASKLRNGATVGAVLVDTVQEYAATTGVTDVYDVKVLQEWAMTGLSMYRIGSASPPPPAPSERPVEADPALGGEEFVRVDLAPNLVENGEAGARWYTDGDQAPELTQYQPVTAKSVVDLTRPGKVLSGVLLTSMQEAPAVGSFEPATATPLVGDNDTEANWKGMAWPASPIAESPGTVRSSTGLRNTATFLPTRFVATGDGVGRLHRYTSIGAQAFYAPVGTKLGDRPEFRLVEGSATGPNTFAARVESVEPAALYTILYRDGADWKRLDLTSSCGATCRTGSTTVAVDPQKVEFIAQLVGHGPGRQVAYSSNKALLYSVDNEPPSIEIRSPLAGSYARGVKIAADYSCADPNGVATCTGTVTSGAPIDTATFGTKTFTVTAVDTAGNQSSKSVTYTVDSYAVRGGGMLYPLNKPDQNPPPKRGNLIPVLFRLDGDEPDGFATAGWTVRRQEVACLAPGTSIGPEFAVTGYGSTRIAYSRYFDTYGYVVDLRDPLLLNRCFRLRVYLDDPAPPTVIESAVFKVSNS